MFLTLLNQLLEGKDLTQKDTYYLMEQMMSGSLNDVQIASLLTALRIKGETVEELIGLVEGMRAYATPLPHLVVDSVDTCGTGGDGGKTFNISTATTFVAAAAGVSIAKHGNRAISSKSGSVDVLEELGITLDLTPDESSKQLNDTGVCFLFAPQYHPAMKYVNPTRKALGFRTCFNLLGPLASPAGVQRQLIGVFSPKYTEKVAKVLQALGSNHALIVSGLDGLDEISLTSPTQVSELKDGQVNTYTVSPQDFGLSPCMIEDLEGGSPKENAAIIREILQGKKSAKRSIVEINAAAVLYVAGKTDSLQAGVQLAAEVIDTGLALQKLEQVAKSSQEVKTHVS
ncbi:anthranilate phosphoribosyltransferase [Shimazuella sp. AN120528]|uniref:anthranilate phosphoribosyltransferase n=1 Tax=Shimazuella soli TaxID=1892854 RepID=UPI001F0EE0A6|nr:anthranilate phosphoribosyltransferase [Shimazuella soli]MCH5585448.1 anthranilate phosphoribosyltransferase [Shimazuella soli]